MAGLIIEGDLSDITEKQLEFIKSVIEERGFKNNKVIIKQLGKAGDNYMANVKRVVVEDENGESLKMVVKLAPQQETQREFANAESIFRNEHIMYTKVLPKYTQLEQAYDVPPQDRFKYPICYGSSDVAPNEIVVLEDLSEYNYTMLNRFVPLNDDCIRSVIKNLAKYHSLGFVLKYKEPQYFDEYKNELQDMVSLMLNKEESAMIFQIMEMNIISALTYDVHKNAVKEALNSCFHNYVKMSDVDGNSKHAVIQHGDAWTNNFMFQIDGDNVQSILIDYQIVKAANPVTDLLFMLSICAEYETKKKHFYEWIDYYHSELDRSLSNFGLKANFIYPKDQLDVDLKRYGKVICGHVIIMLVMLTMKNEDAAAMKEAMAESIEAMSKTSNVNSRDADSMEVFKYRIENLIDSLIEFGLL